MPAASLAPRFRLDEVFHAHERGEIDDARYFAALRDAFGLPLADAELRAGWNAVIGEPLPGMEDLLRELAASTPLYVFSNTNPAHVAHFTPRLATLLAPMRRVICSCELGARKPEAAAFRRVAQLLGLPPQRIGFFDDSEENVAGARAVGYRACGARSAAEVAAALPGMGLRP